MIYALALACITETRVCVWSEADAFATREACAAHVADISAEAKRLALGLSIEHRAPAQWWAFCGRLDELRRVALGAFAGESTT